jgi:hypothetical protein
MTPLSDVVLTYVQDTFQPELQSPLSGAFTLFVGFGITYFEEDLLSIIDLQEELGSEAVRDLFLTKVQGYLTDILREHLIELDQEEEPTLIETLSLCSLLRTVQGLEDRELLGYRVHSDSPPKQLLIDLIGIYGNRPSLLHRHRAMEIIADVGVGLITAFRALVLEDGDKLEEISGDDRTKSRQEWRIFCAFIQDSNCLGIRLSQRGFGYCTIQTLLDLCTEDWNALIPFAAQPSAFPQAALDILSVIMRGSNSYEEPLDAYLRHASTLISNPDHISPIQVIVVQMLSDLSVYRRACLDQRKIVKETTQGATP